MELVAQDGHIGVGAPRAYKKRRTTGEDCTCAVRVV